MKNDRISGIYSIVNRVTGHQYIGQTINIKRRWLQHLNHLRNNQHHNCHLQRAYNLYGEDAFVFSVLEEVSNSNDLDAREQYYLSHFKPEYNLSLISGTPRGAVRSPESRARYVLAQKRLMEDPEFLAKKRTTIVKTTSRPDVRERMRQASIGRKHTDEAKAKISRARKGGVLSLEHRAAISARGMGRHPTEETREKLRMYQSNRPPCSVESRAKMSESQRKRIFNRGADGKFVPRS